jgi:hypothetical protein
MSLTFPLYRLIDISPDLAVAANHVAAVRDLGDGKCAVFLVGQSAMDGGFTVDRGWTDVVGDVNDELERAVEESEEEEGEEEGEENGKG